MENWVLVYIQVSSVKYGSMKFYQGTHYKQQNEVWPWEHILSTSNGMFIFFPVYSTGTYFTAIIIFRVLPQNINHSLLLYTHHLINFQIPSNTLSLLRHQLWYGRTNSLNLKSIYWIGCLSLFMLSFWDMETLFRYIETSSIYSWLIWWRIRYKSTRKPYISSCSLPSSDVVSLSLDT